jgi:hypothetical protein
VPTSLSRTQLVLSEARPETLLPVELSIGARPARATLSRTQLSLADARPAGAAAARRMHDAGDAGEGAKRWMDGASEGDVGVGSEAGEAAVGETGNSGGAAAAAMAGEAAGERAEEKRKSIGNATRWEPEIGARIRRNPKSIRRNVEDASLQKFPREAGKKTDCVCSSGREVYTYEISYYLWLYVSRTVAATYRRIASDAQLRDRNRRSGKPTTIGASLP